VSVVVGYVPDATGFLAVTEAVRQARWRQTDVIVVNAVDTAGYKRPTAADELDLDAVETRLRGDGIAHRIEHRDVQAGHASDVILAVAEECRAELIVVGLHRLSPVRKALLGSTAQRVLLEATCPVLAVRAGSTP